MKKCEVCEVLKGNQDVIFESDFWRVALDSGDQHYPGRSFVTVKRHVATLPELTSEEWEDLHRVMKDLEQAVRVGLGATMFNWSCLTNNAFQEEPFNPHVHWHVRPRYQNPTTVNGEIFEDTEFGHHYVRQTNKQVSSETLRAITALIKQNW